MTVSFGTAAATLGVTRERIRVLAKAGRLVYGITDDGKRGVTKASVDAFERLKPHGSNGGVLGRHISLNIQPGLYATVERVAAERNITPSALIRLAINRYFGDIYDRKANH